jgi:hypothetical protein
MNINIIENEYNDHVATIIFSITNNKIEPIMAISQSILQKSTVSVQTLDRKGNPVAVETGTFQAESSDPSIFSVESVTTSDNINFDIEVVSEGLGTAQLDISADADLGGGIKTITGFAAVEVLPEMAAGFGGFIQGVPVDK